jgi:hypothetical protein
MLEVNCTPLSEINTAGNSEPADPPSDEGGAQLAVDTVFSGMASAHLVDLSMAVRRY